MRSRYRLAAYLTGATAARTGDELSGPALLLLGLAGSAGAGSALLAGLTISAAAGGPLFGALLDRSPAPGRLLTGALAAYAGGLGLVTASFGHAPFPAVVAIAVAAGLVNPAIAGGWTAQLPAVAGAALPRASRLDAITYNAASLTGPGLAGLVATLASAPAALVVAIALVAAALPLAWRLPKRTSPLPGTPLRTQFAAGFSVLVRNRALLRATATSTLSFVGLGMALVCYPLLGILRLGGAGNGTLLVTGLAALSLLANVVLARRPLPLSPDRTVLASTLVLAASFAASAFAPGVVPLVLAAALAGLGQGPQLTSLFAIRHREAPEHVRAQVFTTAASIKITGLALGTAVAGPLAAWSVPGCLLAAAATQLLAAVAYLLCAGRKAVRTPSPARAA
ncbi:MFS transporter [Amycolatopsis sp. NPDC059027]|uniref:MFS transporter n=1 Tax=unclassified Amycolatopsis TaxID=2618356 RepID=UPI00366E20B7